MMRIHRVMGIPLEPGEVVVAAVAHRDTIVVVTDRGTVYQITRDDLP